MKEYVIFDFDGTLVDSLTIGLDVYNQLAEKHGFRTIEPEEINELRKLSIRERIRELEVPIYKIPFLALEFHKLFSTSLAELELFPGIKDMLAELDDLGYKIAIISSNSEANIKEFLAQEGVNSVTEVFSSTSLFGKKRVINKFLKSNNLSKSEVIYVGDEERDIVSCRKLGVEVVWVSWGFDLLEVIKKEEPDYVVDTPEEIIEIVNN